MMGYIKEQRALQGAFFGNKGGGFFNPKKVTKPKTYDFVLKEDYRKDNLYGNIADDAIKYFEDNKIGWWRGKDSMPTNHMLSSQVACVNHLFWLMKNEAAATEVLKGMDPDFRAIPFPKTKDSDDENYVEFEFDGFNKTKNGGRNIIGEKRSSRGATSTSIDAAMLAQKGGQKVLVCIEWKYVEKYSGTAVEKDSRTYRKQRSNYKELLCMSESPISMNLLKANNNFDYEKEYVKFSIEPYYQLMRQTLLAWQLTEKGNDSKVADDYMHLHIIPNRNSELLKGKTSLDISNGVDICEGWKTYLKNPNKYRHMDPRKFIETSASQHNPQLLRYLLDRYWK